MCQIFLQVSKYLRWKGQIVTFMLLLHLPRRSLILVARSQDLYHLLYRTQSSPTFPRRYWDNSLHPLFILPDKDFAHAIVFAPTYVYFLQSSYETRYRSDIVRTNPVLTVRLFNIRQWNLCMTINLTSINLDQWIIHLHVYM